MAVNPTNPLAPTPAGTTRNPASSGGPRLFLREDELLAGLSMLFDAATTLKRLADPVRRETDITVAELSALIALAVHDEPLTALAERLGVGAPTLTRTLDSLDARGFIKRVRDGTDKRRMRTRLSQAGIALVEKLTATMRKQLAGAYRNAGGEAVSGSDAVLAGLVPQRHRNSSNGGQP
jgi:DNA-binding MarR family transcriptional regulator